MLNSLLPKKLKGKQSREHKVLLGLVDYYLKTGKPVGSNTLKEAGFHDLSSATIRNYFANLEENGFLTQQHASGGRIPTHRAYKVYADEYSQSTAISKVLDQQLQPIRHAETREIAAFLQHAAETLSTITQCATFLSAPRFDNDYIVSIKLVPIDASRCLCVIVTDFGLVKSELITVNMKLTAFAVKRIEAYFHWRLTGHDAQENLEEQEEEIAKKIYNELIVRHIVSYSGFINADLYRTGFSKLLSYPELHDASTLSRNLSLFENTDNIHSLVKECSKFGSLKYWIGDDLSRFSSECPECAIVAMPYFINQNIAGVIGIMGPTRMPYKDIFGTIRIFSQYLSEALTRNLYKFKITFRQPQEHNVNKENAGLLVDQSNRLLLDFNS